MSPGRAIYSPTRAKKMTNRFANVQKHPSGTGTGSSSSVPLPVPDSLLSAASPLPVSSLPLHGDFTIRGRPSFHQGKARAGYKPPPQHADDEHVSSNAKGKNLGIILPDSYRI